MPSPETTRFYFLLPDRARARLLLREESEAVTLPFVDVPRDADLLDVGLFNRAAKAQLGLDVTALFSRHCYSKPESPIVIFTLGSHDPDGTSPAGMDWFGEEVVESGRFVSELQRVNAQTWFEEQRDAAPAFLPWWRSGWMDEARAWIEAELARLGLTLTAPIEQCKSWYLSAVMRVPTTHGDLYFKAVPPYFAHEVALSRALPEWASGWTPEVMTSDSDRLWMLTQDMNGRSLEQERTLEAWGAALRDYTRFQLHTAGHLDALLQMGCSDLRLPLLPDRAAALFRALPHLLEGLPEHLNEAECDAMGTILPAIRSLCLRAREVAIPSTLVHGDFHGINVVRSAGRTLFFDWGDACVSHPFFDAMELLAAEDWMPSEENAYDRLRDVYLQEWTGHAPLERLQELWTLLRPLWILAMAFRHVSVLEGMEALCPRALLLPQSYGLWSTRQQQYFLAIQMRDLLKQLR